MTKQSALAAVMRLSATFPAMRLDDQARAIVWVELLEDLDPERLAKAVEALLLSCTNQFGPTPADVRAAVLTQSGPVLPSAAEAWGEVLDQIQNVGWTGAPKLSPLAQRALDCTSAWRDLCATEIDGMGAHRARFLQAYEGLAHRERQAALLPGELRLRIEAGRVKPLVDSTEWNKGLVERGPTTAHAQAIAAKWAGNGMDPEIAGDA